MNQSDICKIKGNAVAGRLEGLGAYESDQGGRYVGHFLDGLFHGEGTLYVKGGYFKGEFEYGRMTEGSFFYADGLKHDEEDWTYCSAEDRRFKVEMDEDAEAEREEPAPLRYTTAYPDQPDLPFNCYDLHTGYFDPEEGVVMSYATGDKLRDVDEEEKAWILANCRKGLTEPEPPSTSD